jgi:CheY-like chemotaxis protein
MLLLCIDDDPEDVDFFCEAMKVVDPSCTCLVARNGREGMQFLEKILPDFIFLDVNMPVMGGKETLAAIKKNSRFMAVPVCILSTSTNKSEMMTYHEMGAYKCFVKPNTFEDLCQMLKDFFQLAMR